MNRTAGYSHHWAIHREFTPSEWSHIVLETARIIQKAKEAGVEVGNESGHGSPTLNRQMIVFNGAPPDEYETFYLSQTPDKHDLDMYQRFVQVGDEDEDGPTIARGFCKTNGKPYDDVVVSVLAVAQKTAPEAITVTSDGGKGAIRRVFGSQSIPPEVTTPPRNTPMSDRALRSHLIRLAHQHPEFRKDILPLVTACDGGAEGPMMGKYEEGKPADPTENMTPEAKKEWEQNTDKYKDKFKSAEEEKKEVAEEEKKKAALRASLIRLAHSNPSLRSDLLPILTASHDVEAGSYQDYLKKKKKQGKPPMKKDEWEARTNGGSQGGSTSKKKDAPKEEEEKDEPKKEKDEPKKDMKSLTQRELDKAFEGGDFYTSNAARVENQRRVDELRARTLKQGGSVTHRATIGIRLRTTRVTPGPAGGFLDNPSAATYVEGVMTMTKGVEDVAPLKFGAKIIDSGSGFFDVVSFAPLRSVSGAGAEGLLSFYKEMFSEIIAANPDLVALR